MRSPADALKNPRPGDVVRLAPYWTRTVTGREPGLVHFDSEYEGESFKGYTIELYQWVDSLSYHNAEVLHVAP